MFSPRPIGFIRTAYRDTKQIPKGLNARHDVEGTLESHSLLTVGPNGKVKANIKAREVIVFGSVKGNVDVVEKVSIRDHGSVIGDIKTAGISIDDGAYFKGSIDIIRPQPQATTKPVKTEAPIVAAAGQP